MKKLKQIWRGFMTWLAKKLGPKFDKYRKDENEIPEIYLPETTEDLVWALKKLPENVLSKADRDRLMSAMSFPDKKVRDIMLPREKVNFVHVNDFMGPITLDKLYQSGFDYFPVLDVNGSIAGIIHTASLNSLEIKETDRAASYVDKEVYYLRDNYTLNEALAAFFRTKSFYFIVVNSNSQIVGILTVKMLIEKLLSTVDEDDFSADKDMLAVAKR
jgi:CBS domain containing-hemolysin-like protein